MRTIKTVQDRLKFLIDFINTDLDTLGSGNRATLYIEMQDYIGVKRYYDGGQSDFGGIVALPLPDSKHSIEEFKEVQAECKTIIESFAFKPFLETKMTMNSPHDESALNDLDGILPPQQIEEMKERKTLFYRPQPLIELPDLLFGITFRASELRSDMLAIGSLKSAFVFSTIFLLTQEDPRKIRVCPHCQKIFYRTGKQQFCSTKCTNSETMKRWRSKLQNRIKESEAAKNRVRSKRALAKAKLVSRKERKTRAKKVSVQRVASRIPKK